MIVKKNVKDCISRSNAHERARTDIAGSTGSLRFVAIGASRLAARRRARAWLQRSSRVVEVQAVRIGPWKSHLMIREGFFDHFQPSSLIVHLRMDPFERHGGQRSNDLAMKMGVAFGGQIQDAVNAHMATFRECKPGQEGGTVRMGGQ